MYLSTSTRVGMHVVYTDAGNEDAFGKTMKLGGYFNQTHTLH
jgi:hypothetical protein